VTNAFKHSETEKVKVSLSQPDEYVCLEIRDWGIGFVPDTVEEGRYGLEGIRQRARLLGGTSTIDSIPGRGTRIVVKLPLLLEDR
jgi:two-component system sensor histidine kinase DegS